jgi:hypothetical protein
VVTGICCVCYLEKLVEQHSFAYAAIAIALMVFAIDLECVVFNGSSGFVEISFLLENQLLKLSILKLVLSP